MLATYEKKYTQRNEFTVRDQAPFDVAVIGGGPAGLMAAGIAAQKRKRPDIDIGISEHHLLACRLIARNFMGCNCGPDSACSFEQLKCCSCCLTVNFNGIRVRRFQAQQQTFGKCRALQIGQHRSGIAPAVGQYRFEHDRGRH